MAAVPAPSRTQSGVNNVKSADLTQRIADAERWQAYARRMNDKAIQSGLATEEEVQIGRMRAEAALTRLRDQGPDRLTTRLDRRHSARSSQF